LVTGYINLVMAVGDPVIKIENYYSEEKT
jgi:hypothetical protein